MMCMDCGHTTDDCTCMGGPFRAKSLSEVAPTELDIARHGAAPSDGLPPLACLDCGLAYSDFPIDTTLPDDQWRMIHDSEGGVLCANCMVKRAAKLPGVVAARMRLEFSGKPPSDGLPEEPAIIQVWRDTKAGGTVITYIDKLRAKAQERQKSAGLCMYCGKDFQLSEYGDSVPAVYEAVIAHDAICQKNPIVRKAQELSDKLAEAVPPHVYMEMKQRALAAEAKAQELQEQLARRIPSGMFAELEARLRQPVDQGGYDGRYPDQLRVQAANAVADLRTALNSQIEITNNERAAKELAESALAAALEREKAGRKDAILVPIKAIDDLGMWLSAALEDKNVCQEMKSAIEAWLNATSESMNKRYSTGSTTSE